MKSALQLLISLLIASTLHAQDVETFWKTTREQLTHEPMEAKVEQVKEALPYRKLKITLRSLGGVKVRAWLALPVQGDAPLKPWPVVISPPGYGGEQQSVMLGECQRGCAILQIFPRSQGDSAALWKIDGPDKLTWHLDWPEGAYYQGAYADVIRAIDFAVSRPDLDAKRIALVGMSQGGGIALAVAALDPRVKAVVAHVPFLCHMRLAARTPGSLVQKLLDQAKRNDDAALSTLDYFDPLALAPQLHASVLMSAGGKDETCPQTTIQAVFDRLPGDKTLKVYPALGHSPSVVFYNLGWQWLDGKLRPDQP